MAKEWTEKEIMQVSDAYWAGCALHAAVGLDLFSALSQGPKEEKTLAQELGCEPRAFAMLATALVALGFLEWEKGRLKAGARVLALLSHDSPEYLGFIIKHHMHIMPAWTQLTEALRSGKSQAKRRAATTSVPAEREAFLMGMFNIARLQAERIADALDLSGRERLVDIGAGPGTYALYFCRKNPHLRATIFDLPTTEPVAREVIARFNLEDRVSFAGGNFLQDPLPPGQDVAWLSQVLHGESPTDAAALVRNAGACLKPGGLLCVQEFVLHDDRTGPAFPSLFALNMLVQTEGGQAYTHGEITEMLHAAGARRVSALNLDLPNGCRVLVGEMPS